MPETTIVVPCYNEEKRLDLPTFRAFVRDCPAIRFLFVNDGSTDGTATLLVGLAESDPERFRILELDRNRGKAEAVRQGWLHAAEAGADYVGYWDADLATPLDVIPEFRAVLDRSPWVFLVMGARVRLLGRNIQRRATRHYLGRVFATTASLALRLPVYDTQCGAKLFRVTDETRAAFERPFASRWIFDVEILARLIEARRRAGGPSIDGEVYEYPLSAWQDVAGSKVRSGDFTRAAFELFAIYRNHLR